MDNSRKFFSYQFLVITAATVVGLYIYHNIIKNQQTQQLYQPRKLNKMSLDNIIMSPKYMLDITTCELDETNKQWIPTLTHRFYGNSQEEIDSLIDSHRKTDSFFNASFEGLFIWKDGEIQLKNVESKLMFTV